MDGGDDRGLVRKHDVLGCVGIAGIGQKTPVDVSSVTDVRVVVLSCRSLKHPLHQTLGLLGPLQEQLDNRSENLQLGLDKKVSRRHAGT